MPFESLKDPEAIENWPHTLGRDGARTPMPWTDELPFCGFSASEGWLPVDPVHAPLSVARQEAETGSCLNVTRALVKLRHSIAALKTGSLQFLQGSNGVLSFERRVENDLIVCVFNLGHVVANWRPAVADGEWQVLATQDGLAAKGMELPDRLQPWTGYWARSLRLGDNTG